MQEQVTELVKKFHNFRVLYGDEVAQILLEQLADALENGYDFIPQGEK